MTRFFILMKVLIVIKYQLINGRSMTIEGIKNPNQTRSFNLKRKERGMRCSPRADRIKRLIF